MPMGISGGYPWMGIQLGLYLHLELIFCMSCRHIPLCRQALHKGPHDVSTNPTNSHTCTALQVKLESAFNKFIVVFCGADSCHHMVKVLSITFLQSDWLMVSASLSGLPFTTVFDQSESEKLLSCGKGLIVYYVPGGGGWGVGGRWF